MMGQDRTLDVALGYARIPPDTDVLIRRQHYPLAGDVYGPVFVCSDVISAAGLNTLTVHLERAKQSIVSEAT